MGNPTIIRKKRRRTPNPSQDPPQEFLDYFADEWQRKLDSVKHPWLRDASWDRKAAWLLWIGKR